jgi:hypothetical protein
MTEILRLKSYKTYLDDGKSYVGYGTEKGQVGIAIILGYEPAKIDKEEDCLKIDDVILEIATHIKKARKEKKMKAKAK